MSPLRAEGRPPSESGSVLASRDVTRRSKSSSDVTRTDIPVEMTTMGKQENIKDEVNVAKAERQFAELNRQLSRVSRVSHRDQEKNEEPFDLAEYMHDTSSAREAHGFHRKHIGVVFDKLAVVGAGGMKLSIRTLPDAIKEFLMAPMITVMMRMPRFLPPPKQILHSFSGFLKPGEMCLVLGRPGSGCSTFLKVIANQRLGYMSINGDVEYGGLDASIFAKRHHGEVVYNQEDDIHNATLTVSQTLEFALNTKTPGKRLPEQTRKKFREELLTTMLKMLNIEHTRNTLVGSADVRGVSGGERKRVSIAEMMTTRACVLSWDNSTRGLDASTALDYAKSLRIVTNVFKSAMFVSLYQAGEGIYNQFDKVLLINEGRQVYFGPAKEARAYMMGLGYRDLPRQTTADYLTGCTDENERQFADDVDPATVPSTPEELEKAYLASDIYKRMNAEKEEYRAEAKADQANQNEFLAAVKQEKRKGVSGKSPFTVPFLVQVWAIAVRTSQIRMQDRVGFVVSWVTTITVATIVGSCFLSLPETAAGAFTRGGVMFITLLFNAFMSFNELPSQMMGRPIIWKQSAYGFYRPAAQSLGAILSDMPFQFSTSLVFSIIIYFMSGLALNGGAFWTFVAVVFANFIALASFFRLLGAISFNYNTAGKLASVLVNAMVLYSGYLIPVQRMQRFMFWLYYINPVNYGFGALMGNEFGRISLACDGAFISPRGPGYPSDIGPNQACTLPGSVPGNARVSGEAYISASFRYHAADVWRNFGILVAFFILFLGLQFLAAEKLSLGRGAPAINVFNPENEERKKLNETLQSRKKDFRSGKAQQDLTGLIQTRKPFTWEDLTYDVSVPGGQRRLLSNIFGYVKPGTLTALMGASGAGKTTLLDVLAQRKNVGVIGGDILVAGRAPGRDFQRGTAYCEQLDTHEFTQTVREALRFSAYLRQSADISIEEKNAYVEEVIQLLEMEDFADAMLGFSGFGLDVEARKRVTIGVELAAKPQLLLFLDEPTSGLDGQSAYNIVRFLRKLASAGQAILCTIHQPNALLFENFDRLLLLKSGGRCVYFGDIGKDSHVIREYYRRNGAECPPDANPAEFMLDAVGAGTQRQVGDRDWADIWLDSPEHAENKREIQRLKTQSLTMPAAENVAASTEYATPFWTQMRFLIKRTNLAMYRNADYQWTRLFNHIAIALLTGLTFLNLDDSVSALQYRSFIIFMAAVLPIIIIAQIEPSYIMARDVFVRESSSKMYSPAVFHLSQFIGELPYAVICAVAYFLLFYYPSGFQADSSRAGYTFFMVLAIELYAVTLGQAVAALSPSIMVAGMVNPFLAITLTLFCGVTIPGPSMPKFWREWMWPLDPFTRLIGGLLANEISGIEVQCKDSEFAVFQPPSGQNCEQWAGSFVSSSGGFLQNPNASANCRYCPYASGDQYLAPLGLSYGNRWRDLGIFIAFSAFNFLVGIAGARWLTFRYSKR